MAVRTAFSKNGGNLGESGSVAFTFDQVGKIEYPLEVADEDGIRDLVRSRGLGDVYKRQVLDICPFGMACHEVSYIDMVLMCLLFKRLLKKTQGTDKEIMKTPPRRFPHTTN